MSEQTFLRRGQKIVIQDHALLNCLREFPSFNWFIGLLPAYNPLVGGKKRKYPDFAYVLFLVAVELFGSERKAEAYLETARLWYRLRKELKDLGPERSDLYMPKQPMSRNVYTSAKHHYLLDEKVRDYLKPKFHNWAGKLALELGLLDPNGEGTPTSPSTMREVFGDVKVAKPRYYTTASSPLRKSRKTGEEYQPRYCHSARTCFTGGGERVYGMPFFNAMVRGPLPKQCICLDFEFVRPGAGGEAKVAVNSYVEIAERLPGVQLFAYDGAVRGVHLREIMKTSGVLAISGIGIPMGGTDEEEVMAQNRAGRRRRRKVRDHWFGPHEMTLPNGSKHTVTLRLYEGAPVIVVRNIDGGRRYIELVQGQIRRREQRDKRRKRRDRYFFYVDYFVPKVEASPDGTLPLEPETSWAGGKFRLRLDQMEKDVYTDDGKYQTKILNREEHFRVFPPNHPRFHELYFMRQNSEVFHRLYDDSRMREWTRSVEWEGVWLDVFAHYMVMNVIALTLHRRRRRVGTDAPVISEAA